MDQNREIIELIKERVDIVHIVEQYVKLKPAEKNHTGLCLFHNEKTPSFTGKPEMQIFKCFGCGKGGDVFTFIQEIEKLSFPESLEKLANLAGIKLQENKKDSPYKYIEDLNSTANTFFKTELVKSVRAIKYLKQRGFTKDIIKKFSIGYAPKGNLLFQKVNSTKKLTKDKLISSGLFVERSGILRDKFVDRIMFPIRSTSGTIIGYSGRVLPENKYGPKYLNSPETALFKKTYSLYGQYESKQEIRKEDLCIVCEGQTDVISTHMLGINNIVAPLGTSLTTKQLELIKRYTNNVFFIFDSDTAGENALEKAFLLSSPLGLNAYAASPKPYKDIDELIQNNPKGLKNLIQKRTDLFSYLISNLTKTKNITKYEEHNFLISYIKKLLCAVPDSEQINYYISKANKITGLSFSADFKQEGRNEMRSTKVKMGNLALEHFYLQSILNNDVIRIPDGHNLNIFSNPIVKNILKKISTTEELTIKKLHTTLENSEKVLLENVLLHQKETFDSSEYIYKRILKLYIENKLKLFRTKLAAAEEIYDKESINRYLLLVKKYSDKLSFLKNENI